MMSMNAFLTKPEQTSFMHTIAQEIDRFVPLVAQRCVMSGWRPSSPISGTAP